MIEGYYNVSASGENRCEVRFRSKFVPLYRELPREWIFRAEFFIIEEHKHILMGDAMESIQEQVQVELDKLSDNLQNYIIKGAYFRAKPERTLKASLKTRREVSKQAIDFIIERLPVILQGYDRENIENVTAYYRKLREVVFDIHVPDAEPRREYRIQQVLSECKKQNLPKKETVSREIKYEIAKDVKLEVPDFDNFKSGEKTYNYISKMLSELGYSKKPASRY